MRVEYLVILNLNSGLTKLFGNHHAGDICMNGYHINKNGNNIIRKGSPCM